MWITSLLTFSEQKSPKFLQRAASCLCEGSRRINILPICRLLQTVPELNFPQRSVMISQPLQINNNFNNFIQPPQGRNETNITMIKRHWLETGEEVTGRYKSFTSYYIHCRCGFQRIWMIREGLCQRCWKNFRGGRGRVGPPLDPPLRIMREV